MYYIKAYHYNYNHELTNVYDYNIENLDDFISEKKSLCHTMTIVHRINKIVLTMYWDDIEDIALYVISKK